MIPFLLAGLGGYLIGQSQKKDVPEMGDGGGVMSKYHITIMSEDYDDDNYEDNHQKYGFSLMAIDENDAIKKGKEKFMAEHSGYPIHWIKAFKISEMAKGGTINLNKDYKIVIKKTNSPSNYNLFASLFKKGEKFPLIGSTFKSTDTKEDIKGWFEQRMKNGSFQDYIDSVSMGIDWQDDKESYDKMAKGGATGDVEVSLILTKEEAQIVFVVLEEELKGEGRKIPKIKSEIKSKVMNSFTDDFPDEVELRLSVDKLMLIYLYLNEVSAKEPKFKTKMIRDINNKIFEAVKRSGLTLPKYFAMGGVLEHGLREGDRLLVAKDRFAGIIDKDGQRVIVDIEEGHRRASTI